METRSPSEHDICTKFITPALRRAGWDEITQIREEASFAKGWIIVRGKMVSRGKGKRAVYILSVKPNIPIALIEAKENTQSVGAGLQQGLEYAETLVFPFLFSSNGDGFVFHDRTGRGGMPEVNLKLDQFPSPDEPWERYRKWTGLSDPASAVALQDYFDDGSGKALRRARPCGAAAKDLGRGDDQEMGRGLNNRAEKSHLPFRRRERAMMRFRPMRSCRSSLQSMPRSTATFRRSATSRTATPTRRPALPLSQSGAAFARPEIRAG